ncbi:four helix bundle protein [Hymenobacter metallilatus]|uniref:Four helix bundle protein n=1 Tax=Hymenobacter metallilatus TaxID=2493666 RepID=A0A3R9NLC4_9BACT|nr:four helix bundle protein [Hymenobacter metallilatus]RSK31186.1 four helix bundle protein [Hymenobacter metallilatus]
MHDYRKLRVWHDAIELAVEVYQLTALFPASEKFNLISQMNRAAVSVGSNIGEGAGRGSNAEFIQFLHYASGSCTELITQLTIAERLGFATPVGAELAAERIKSVHRQVFTLIQTLRKE